MSLPIFVETVTSSQYPDVLLDIHENAQKRIHAAIARAEIAIRQTEATGGWWRGMWDQWQEVTWPALAIRGQEFFIEGPPHWEAGLAYVQNVVATTCEAVTSVYATSGGLQGLDKFLRELVEDIALHVYDTKLYPLDSGDQRVLHGDSQAYRDPNENRDSFIHSFVRPRMSDRLGQLVMDAWSRVAMAGGSPASAEVNGHDPAAGIGSKKRLMTTG